MSTPVEQIKDRLDIVEVIGGYIKLSKAGKNYKARCPFHNEKTPSFSVSAERQFFYCFGCQAKGDIFTFVEKFEGTDFSGALKLLADKAGVKLEKSGPVDKEKQEEKEKLFEIMEESTLIFQNNLKTEKDALSYLKKRGINEQSINSWRIGFAKDEWRDAHDKLISAGFAREEILKAGMIKKVEGQDKYYDTFRDRIMFPIFDTSGKAIAFSGRILHDKENSPKYVNSPETDLFYKSETLYGLHEAKSEIRRLDYAVLVEGQMDLVLSHQAGVKNTVASSGTALTEGHLRKIKKISNRIIVAYDSDEAGAKAGLRAGELALSLGLEVKIAVLPAGEDPASVILSDVEKWKEHLKKAYDIIELAADKAIKKSKGPVPLAKEINISVLPYLRLIQNEIVKSQYVAMLAKKTGIPQEAILAELAKAPLRETPLKQENNTQETYSIIEPLSFNPGEMILGLALWQNKGELKEKIGDRLGKEYLEDVMSGSSFDRDTLVFEMENRFANLDIDKMVEEKILIIEKERYKKKLALLSEELDKVSKKEDKEKIKKEIKELISKYK